MWIAMEGSSQSGRERYESSRGLDSSGVVDWNSRFRAASTIRLSSDAYHDSGFVSKGWERIESSDVNCLDDQGGRGIDCKDVSLRHWLDSPERTVDALECLHIFTQIVEIVKLAHTQGIAVHNVRPSCFVMSSFNRVAFIESASCSDSGSDSCEDEPNSSSSPMQVEMIQGKDSAIASESSCLQSSSGHMVQTLEAIKNRQVEENNNKHTFPMKQILHLETNWYTSPEEVNGAPGTCASDIYQLGVLLFELYCTFKSSDEKIANMSCLRHRVLPPQLLLKWPKEASFCLWLLHPEPSSRPKVGELLESEFLKTPRHDLEEREAAIELREKIDEQELLLEFLLLIQQKKQEAMENLQEIVSFLSSDVEEATKMQTTLKLKGGSSLEPAEEATKMQTPLKMKGGASLEPAKHLNSRRTNVTEDHDSGSSGSRKRSKLSIDEESDGHPDEIQKSERNIECKGSISAKSSRLMKNFRKLEAAYFMTRRRVIKRDKSMSRNCQTSQECKSSATATERSSLSNLSSKGGFNGDRQRGWINSYLEGLCKYFSFSKLEVKADLKQGDLLNSSNLVCSLSFDRDGEFFATAGVNKKIKVFEYNSILNADRDIHYPVIEMANRSKLSSICWNGYIKSQLASSNFEGVVQVWDVTRSQLFMEMREHEKRVWSVDFSIADPTMLASGSDDGSVKLWNINQAILLLHLVDVSFKTKWSKCWNHKNKSQCLLCSVPC
ncbi:protein SPA1-RELATED 3-like isoform X2 [Solanum dulcamara]|uniref:protein SPA1-RELATED 3-like isoform X2 n=1 Tax=Solanum dulcamara TaxID=45834 RepID=UPI00248625BB|nr:protein SPA1-RELATED 3-like isoform X2 [Solanum dulcamara]